MRLPSKYLHNPAFCTLPSAKFTLEAELHSALTNNSEFHRFADSVEVRDSVAGENSVSLSRSMTVLN